MTYLIVESWASVTKFIGTSTACNFLGERLLCFSVSLNRPMLRRLRRLVADGGGGVVEVVTIQDG